MDRVRLGRALGYGARHAARTLASAVDAATAPNPGGASRPPGAGSAAANSGGATPRATTASQAAQVYRTVDDVKQQARGVGRSVLAPIRTFSSVIWLQVTGTFFAVFAAFMGEGVWKLRANFKAPVSSPEAHKVYFHLIVFLGFAYFTVSNFVRAYLRERR